jgi:hypothetical protein
MTFNVESDARLAHDVGPPASDLALTGVAGMGSQVSPYVLPPNPWAFLLAAGRASAAIFSPVRELFDVSSHWAIARWFWALDWSSTEVRLSPYAEQIRNHHRTAFSEALGLAAALLVVEHVTGNTLPPGLWRGGPLLLDVDSLVSHGTRPDLFVLFGDPALTTYVLEAKGNSKDRDVSVKQLRRGVVQVLAAPGQAERLVVGAAARKSAVNVHAVSVRQPQPRMTGGILTVAKERALEMERRRLINFSGAADLEARNSTFEIPELNADLVGRRLVLSDNNIAAEVTMGVDREILRRLREVGSIAELSEMRSAISGDNHRWIDGESEVIPLGEIGRAATMALDGCALSISLA